MYKPVVISPGLQGKLNLKKKRANVLSFLLASHAEVRLIQISYNCGLGLKRRNLNFADIFFCGFLGAEKNTFVLQEATTEAMKDSSIMLR